MRSTTSWSWQDAFVPRKVTSTLEADAPLWRSVGRSCRTSPPMRRLATTPEKPTANGVGTPKGINTRSGTPSRAHPEGHTLKGAGKQAGEHQSLSLYIQTRFDECSRSQKDVAQYIVDHLDEAAFQTAEELARRANTSSSTVVRFSQALGFEGFPELQQAARDEYRRRVGGGGLAAETLTAAAPLF